jgi:O-antigen/teichoic acid export membrane protein
VSGSSLGRRELQDRAARGAAWTLIHTVVSIPIAFVVNVLIARVLGVVDYGRLALLTLTIGLVGTVLVSGVDSALTQFGARAHAAGRAEEVRDLLSRVQGFRLLALAPVSTAVVLLVVDVSPPLLVTALVLGVWVPAAFSGAKVCLTVEQRTATDAKIHLVGNLLTQLLVVAVLFTVATADAVWVARTAAGGAIVFSALFFISPAYRRAVLRPRSPFGLGRPFWRYALPTGFALIVSTLVISRSELFFLDALSTPVQAGLFAMAFGVAGHLLAPAQALLNPLTPAVAGLHEVDDEAVAPALRRILRTSSTLAGAVVAVAGPALALLTPVIYGPDYAPARAMVLALLGTSALLVVTYPMQTFVMARLRGRSILTMNLVSLAFGVAVAVTTIGPLGAWGAVLAKAAVTLSRTGYLLVAEADSFRTGRLTVLRDLTPLWLGIAAAWACYVVAVPSAHTVLASLAAALAGAIVFVVGLRLTRSGLTPRDAAVAVEVLPGPLAPVARVLSPLVTAARTT